MKRLSKLLPHLTIILAGMFIVFWILDILNPTMNFINRKISNKLLLIFCISAIVTAILAVYNQRKNERIENSDKIEKQ
ncbi:hypothetical protein [Ruminococcus sp.]|uniref:hypothetical protein n=1 Tax=Ruminococcus sp. TaxID=41978 RepID=UPI0025CE3113|nr:hypothetical protein [Ruminococcus sp.]